MTITHLTRPGGRRVALHDLTPDAPADAPVVLFCHIAPGSGRFDPDPAATAASGVRLIALDRPGYGRSDPVGPSEFATVGVAADDAVAALESVLAPGTRARIAGWSAGGRVALAAAARRPDLVGAVAVIGTPAPDEEVPWIPEEYNAVLAALRDASAEKAHAELSAAFAPMLASLTGDARFGLLGVADADAAVLAVPGVADRLRAMIELTLAQGDTGMIADLAGYTLRPWGFDPADVAAPVLLGYGAADFVGPQHGEWWQKKVQNGTLEIVPDVGHLLVVRFWERALAHLRSAG